MRATITIDELAKVYFPKDGKSRRDADILAELLSNLQDKGDDPRYGRVIFAVHGEDRFVEVNDDGVRLTGVFPRMSCVRYEYGNDNRGLKNVMNTNLKDPLIVADREVVAQMWERELRALEYTIKRI